MVDLSIANWQSLPVVSIDWLKGKITGNHPIFHRKIGLFPVKIFPSTNPLIVGTLHGTIPLNPIKSHIKPPFFPSKKSSQSINWILSSCPRLLQVQTFKILGAMVGVPSLRAGRFHGGWRSMNSRDEGTSGTRSSHGFPSYLYICNYIYEYMYINK